MRRPAAAMKPLSWELRR